MLERLDEAAPSTLLNRAEQLTGHRLPLDDDARRALIAMADGDGRYLLNMVEQLQALPDAELRVGVRQVEKWRRTCFAASADSCEQGEGFGVVDETRDVGGRLVRHRRGVSPVRWNGRPRSRCGRVHVVCGTAQFVSGLIVTACGVLVHDVCQPVDGSRRATSR